VKDLPVALEAGAGRKFSTIGVETDILPALNFERLQKLFAGVNLQSSTHPIILTRAIKSEKEIEAMKNACAMVREGAATAAKTLRAGMTELELAAHIEYRMRLMGHAGYTPMRSFNHWLFYGHVMAGKSAARAGGFDMPTSGSGLSPLMSQSASTRQIEEGEPVSVDLVGNCGGYLCDQTRLFSVGPIESIFAKAFDAAVKVQEKVIKHARPGAVCSELYDIALREADESGFGDNFLGEGDAVSFVGHGIGLEVDEYPFIADKFPMKLQEGMVFALEPKFIFKGRGIVGIEDTFVVRADGCERITTSPREIIVV
ncbi:aminopeptidase P family protein, partial [bacterium]